MTLRLNTSVQADQGQPNAAFKSNCHRILLVDDHPILRDGITAQIERQADMSVCGSAETAAGALEAIIEKRPDLVIIDLSLGDSDGLELIKSIRSCNSKLPVLVFTMHDESLYAERSLRAGALGFVMKKESSESLIKAIRQVLKGEIYLSSAISARLLKMMSGQTRHLHKTPVDLFTDREFETFQLIGKGLTTHEIAQRLKVSIKTVEVHRANIRKKLDVHSGPELIRYAVRWMEGQPPQREMASA